MTKFRLNKDLEAEQAEVIDAMKGYIAANPTSDTLSLRHMLNSLTMHANHIDELHRTLAMKSRMLQLLRLEKD